VQWNSPKPNLPQQPQNPNPVNGQLNNKSPQQIQQNPRQDNSELNSPRPNTQQPQQNQLPVNSKGNNTNPPANQHPNDAPKQNATEINQPLPPKVPVIKLIDKKPQPQPAAPEKKDPAKPQQ
jgi:hypothetical protein